MFQSTQQEFNYMLSNLRPDTGSWLSTMEKLVGCVHVLKSKVAEIGTLLLPVIVFIRKWWRCLSVFSYFIIIIVIIMITIISLLYSNIFIALRLILYHDHWLTFLWLKNLSRTWRRDPNAVVCVLAWSYPRYKRYVFFHWLKTLCID